MGYRNTSWSLLCSEQRLCNRPGIESRFLHSLCDANISDSCCTYISTWCLLKADTVCWSCKSYLCFKPSWYNSGISYPTHVLLIDSILHGDWIVAWDAFLHLILPSLTLALA